MSFPRLSPCLHATRPVHDSVYYLGLAQHLYTPPMEFLNGLLRLHSSKVPLEDFFTEVLAGILRHHPALGIAWLTDMGVMPEYSSPSELVSVSTQRRLVKLEDHALASRPDLELKLRTPERDNHLIFIESKVGSHEGVDQLWRYADHLLNTESYEHKTLIYVTRNYDPKEHSAVLEGIESVGFVQSRWSDFNRVLTAYERKLAEQGKDSELAREVLGFMEAHGMEQQNRLSASEVSAMTYVPRVMNFMRETLSGEVDTRLAEVSDQKVAGRYQTLWRVEDQGRYYHFCLMPSGFWCGAGFWLDVELPHEYPSLSVVVEVGPNHPRREEIIAAMRSHAKTLEEPAYPYGLEEAEAWSGIEWWQDLGALLGEEDHMSAVREFFMWGLDQLEEFRKSHPDLPWANNT